MITFFIENSELKTDKKGQSPKDATEALEWSIAKWKFIAEHIDEICADGGPATCGLCKLFIDTELSCQICPIGIKTGSGSCCDTPYEEWDTLSDQGVPKERLKEVALKEVAFLESVQKEMPELMDLSAELMDLSE